MTGSELAKKAVYIATNLKTTYIQCCYGYKLEYNSKIVNQINNSTPDASELYFIKDNEYNRTYLQTIKDNLKKLKLLTTSNGIAKNPVYAFDCIGLVKGIFWGFDDKKSSINWIGADTCGAILQGESDLTSDSTRNICKDHKPIAPKYDNSMDVGTLVFLDGHVGIYIGHGLIVQATPGLENKGLAMCVAITKLQWWNDMSSIPEQTKKVVKEFETALGRQIIIDNSFKTFGKYPFITYDGQNNANNIIFEGYIAGGYIGPKDGLNTFDDLNKNLKTDAAFADNKEIFARSGNDRNIIYTERRARLKELENRGFAPPYCTNRDIYRNCNRNEKTIFWR